MKTISTTLRHLVVVPDRPSRQKHPTMILLHGRGADEQDLLGLAPKLDPQLLLLSVRAPYPFPYSGGYTWYDVQDIGSPDAAMFADSYDRLVRFVEDVVEGYPVDPSRLFLMGFSMGAVMSFALALTQPDRFRGIVAHSGYIPEEANLTFQWNKLAGTSFFVAHGTQDPVIPVSSAHRARELLSRLQAPAIVREYPIAHSIGEESITDIARWLRPLLEADQA